MNPTLIGLKTYYRLLFVRPAEIYKLDIPLLIVSGLQRSGTTLMTQLLNNHRQLLSYFQELYIGDPKKYHWPNLMASDSPEKRFKKLIPENYAKKFWRKGPKQKGVHNTFLFDFFFFKKKFIDLDKGSTKQRDCLNAFFSAYFAAYINYNHNNYFHDYKFIAASVPSLTIYHKSVDGFFEDYPDGILINMIREPAQWYNSAKHHNKRFKESGLKIYENHLNNCIICASKYKHRFLIVSFEKLLRNVDITMKKICSEINIDHCDTLNVPSNFPYKGIDNSSFGRTATTDVIVNKLDRKVDLTSEESSFIDANLRPPYEKLIKNYTINSA
jgi:hypothetical protein